MAWVTIDADVDLRDFDTNDLIEELERRNRAPESSADISIQQIFDAFYTGNETFGLTLTKSCLQQATGRVLP